MSARRKIASEQFASDRIPARATETVVNIDVPASPALAMRAALEAQLRAPKRWRPLATSAFVVATCGGFWSALAWAAARLLHG